MNLCIFYIYFCFEKDEKNLRIYIRAGCGEFLAFKFFCRFRNKSYIYTSKIIKINRN